MVGLSISGWTDSGDVGWFECSPLSSLPTQPAGLPGVALLEAFGVMDGSDGKPQKIRCAAASGVCWVMFETVKRSP